MKKKVYFLSILIILSFLLVSCKEQVVETNNTMPSTTIAPTTETNDSQTNNKVYLEVKDYKEAEAIVNELGKYLLKNKRKDLTPEEKEKMREEYAQWMRKNLLV